MPNLEVVAGEVAAALDVLAAVRGEHRPALGGVPDRLGAASDWQAIARWTAAVDALLAGRRQDADRLLRQGELVADTLGSRLPAALSLGLIAGLALQDRRSADSVRAADLARVAMSDGGIEELPMTALPRSVIAAVEAAGGDLAAARCSLAVAQRLSAAAHGVAPWFIVMCNVFQATACLSLGDVGTARSLLRDAAQWYRRGPASDVLRAFIDAAHQGLTDYCAGEGAGHPALTTAETRVLHYLPTQLSFPEIAGRLFVSRHTVKTQALAIYHKFGVSSRTAAVERARIVGLLPEPAGLR